MFVKEAAVQQSMRPVEPCVMKVIKQHDCQQDVQDLHMQQLVRYQVHIKKSSYEHSPWGACRAGHGVGVFRP